MHRTDGLYFSAGNFCARVTRRLGGKVVWVLMHNHSFANNVTYAKFVCQHHQKGIAVSPKQRRKVARVIRVRAVCGGEMRFGFGKWVLFCACTKFAFVNVKGKNWAVALVCGFWQAHYVCQHYCPISCLIKPNFTPYATVCFVTLNICHSTRSHSRKIFKTWCVQVRFCTPKTFLLYMKNNAIL